MNHFDYRDGVLHAEEVSVAAIASPTSASFSYMAAVSTWR
mgnify:CR=1 FL=1